jgi:hypothetical protein
MGCRQQTWEVLSCSSQLQRLEIAFDPSLRNPFSLKHCFAGLTGSHSSSPTSSSLLSSSLTSLRISARHLAQNTADYQALLRLTVLQQLTLPVAGVRGLDSIAACTALQRLELVMDCMDEDKLTFYESGVLGQLTLLTELRILEVCVWNHIC